MNLRTFILVLFFLISVCLAVFGFGTKLAASDVAFERVGLIYSIFTAAIITSMSVIGSRNHQEKNWITTWTYGKKNVSRLAYFILLFYLYMITLSLMVIVELSQYIFLSCIIKKLLGFLIPFTFFLSAPIPFVLFKVKSEQMNESVNNARSNT